MNNYTPISQKRKLAASYTKSIILEPAYSTKIVCNIDAPFVEIDGLYYKVHYVFDYEALGINLTFSPFMKLNDSNTVVIRPIYQSTVNVMRECPLLTVEIVSVSRELYKSRGVLDRELSKALSDQILTNQQMLNIKSGNFVYTLRIHTKLEREYVTKNTEIDFINRCSMFGIFSDEMPLSENQIICTIHKCHFKHEKQINCIIRSNLITCIRKTFAEFIPGEIKVVNTTHARFKIELSPINYVSDAKYLPLCRLMESTKSTDSFHMHNKTPILLCSRFITAQQVTLRLNTPNKHTESQIIAQHQLQHILQNIPLIRLGQIINWNVMIHQRLQVLQFEVVNIVTTDVIGKHETVAYHTNDQTIIDFQTDKQAWIIIQSPLKLIDTLKISITQVKALPRHEIEMIHQIRRTISKIVHREHSQTITYAGHVLILHVEHMGNLTEGLIHQDTKIQIVKYQDHVVFPIEYDLLRIKHHLQALHYKPTAIQLAQCMITPFHPQLFHKTFDMHYVGNLIYGPEGCGKSHYIRQLIHILQLSSAHTITINCEMPLAPHTIKHAFDTLKLQRKAYDLRLLLIDHYQYLDDMDENYIEFKHQMSTLKVNDRIMVIALSTKRIPSLHLMPWEYECSSEQLTNLAAPHMKSTELAIPAMVRMYSYFETIIQYAQTPL